MVATSHQRRRLATEASTAVAVWLGERGTTALVAHVHPADVASAATAAASA